MHMPCDRVAQVTALGTGAPLYRSFRAMIARPRCRKRKRGSVFAGKYSRGVSPLQSAPAGTKIPAIRNYRVTVHST